MLPTFCKCVNKPSCIDLILTNNKFNFFQHGTAFKTDLPHVHLLTVTEFKTVFQKQKPLFSFDNEKFRSDVLKHNFDKRYFGSYKDTIFNLFNKYVPLKKKNVGTN